MSKIRAIRNIFLPKKMDAKELLGIERARPWFEADGDKTLRLDYPRLTPKSIVFDLGGFEGQWASDIYAKYLSKVYIFEPFEEYFQAIKARFKKNPYIKPFPYALSAERGKVKLFTNGDKTSQFLEGDSGEFVMMCIESFTDFCKSHDIKKIDLMKINIEGGEYDLLDGIIAAGWLKNIVTLQIQFHDYTPDAEQRMRKIQTALRKTHKPTYQFKFIWENWTLK